MSKYKKILRVHRNVFEDPMAEIQRLRAALRAFGVFSLFMFLVNHNIASLLVYFYQFGFLLASFL